MMMMLLIFIPAGLTSDLTKYILLPFGSREQEHTTARLTESGEGTAGAYRLMSSVTTASER